MLPISILSRKPLMPSHLQQLFIISRHLSHSTCTMLIYTRVFHPPTKIYTYLARSHPRAKPAPSNPTRAPFRPPFGTDLHGFCEHNLHSSNFNTNPYGSVHSPLQPRTLRFHPYLPISAQNSDDFSHFKDILYQNNWCLISTRRKQKTRRFHSHRP